MSTSQQRGKASGAFGGFTSCRHCARAGRSGPRLFPNDFGTISLVEASFGSVSLRASGTSSPSLIADANIGPNLFPSISGRASWLLDYALKIVGPTGSVPVLIDVAGGASGVANTGA